MHDRALRDCASAGQPCPPKHRRNNMSDDNTQIPINCTFTINKDDLPSGSDIDLSHDNHKDEIIDIVKNSWRIEEWIEELASSKIESDYSYEIDKGVQAYDNFENLELDDFDSFNDLYRRVNELDQEDGDGNSDITRLWRHVMRLEKTLEEVSRLFVTWANYDSSSATQETIHFFGSTS
tara:strand:- start:15 stop:551 length:537 start_codon:yes stop_codon:yes gene_type:complete